MTEGKGDQGLDLGKYQTEFGFFSFFFPDENFMLTDVVGLQCIWSGMYLWVQMTTRGAQLPAQGIVHPLVLLAHRGRHSVQSLLKMVNVNQWNVTNR